MTLLRSVGFRLFVLSLGIFAVLAVTAGLLTEVARQEEKLKDLAAEHEQRVEHFHSVQHALSNLRLWHGNLTTAALTQDKVWRAQAEQALAEARTDLETRLEALAPIAAEGVSAVRAGVSALPGPIAGLVAALQSNRRADAERHMRQVREIVVKIEAELTRAERKVLDDYTARSAAGRERAATDLRFALYCTAMTVIFGALLAFTVTGSLIRPLQRLALSVRHVAAGYSRIALPTLRDDEFGDMNLALQQFQDQAEKLRVIAYRDGLTGLANRTRLDEALHKGILDSARNHGSLGLLFLDLDNFKSVNDSLGHSAGDRFLREASRRLQRLVPESVLVSRYSGDKFTILVDGLKRDGKQQAQLRDVAGAILRGMAEPYRSGEDFLYMTVSIGIAIYPIDGQSPEQLVSAADAAMYLAKRSGRNTVQFASPDLTEGARRHLLLAGEIRRGLAAGEFTPYYQPIVNVRTGEIAGAEALLRWHHPQRGTVLPGEFIRVAEDSGLIGELGEHCLTMAYEQAVRWARQGRETSIAVNLSARQLLDRKILSVVQQLQTAQQLGPHCLEFEITESAVMERPELSQQTLQDIRRRGHKLGIDDFGTGHSALGYLQRFPIDRIKIDRSFVERVETSRQSRAIISATLALAENLGLDVVAEGVESQVQMNHMRDLGCMLHQGYFFTPALPASEFEVWLAARQ